MITKEQIQAVVHSIVEGYAPDKIILSGTYAYGEPTEHSDLDLLVIKKKAEAKRVERAIAVRVLLCEANDATATDTLTRTPARMEHAAGIFQSVKTIAEQQGRLLYAA